MRSSIATALVLVIVASPVLAADRQRVVTPGIESQVWQQMATTIPPGSRIKLQTTSGKRITATLMGADENGIIIKKNTRVAEPAVALRYDELAQLARDEGGGGMSIGKAIGVGLAAGAGAILTLFAIALSFDD